jgi:hypothetical protein
MVRRWGGHCLVLSTVLSIARYVADLVESQRPGQHVLDDIVERPSLPKAKAFNRTSASPTLTPNWAATIPVAWWTMGWTSTPSARAAANSPGGLRTA